MKTLTWVTAILLVSSCVGCTSSPPQSPPGPGWTRTETGPVHAPSRKPATYPTQRERPCRDGYERDGYGDCTKTVGAIVENEAMRAVERGIRDGISRAIRCATGRYC